MSDLVFEGDGVRLYQGDCLDVMSHLDERVDACVMDPPYASGTRSEASRSTSGAMVRGRFAGRPLSNDQMTTPGFVWLMREVALALRSRIEDGGHVLSFIDWRQWPNLLGAVESADLRVNGMLVWDKGSMGMGSQHELILHASVGKPRMVYRDTSNVLQVPRDRETDHPSPKPVGLMEALLRATVPPGGVVIDPFAGAGATLVAARNLGLQAIGCELDPTHCATAITRL